jgi:hypothetical protein
MSNDLPSMIYRIANAGSMGKHLLPNLCFLARRDDFEPPANRSLTVTALLRLAALLQAS